MTEESLTKSVYQLLAQAPKAVQRFVLNELSTTVEGLMNKHALHVDQGGLLEAELLLMLVGQSAPTEFTAALAKAGIPKEKVSAIVEDVNREVFTRIRKEEQGGTPVPQPPEQRSISTPPTPPPARTPVPIYSPLPAPRVSPILSTPAPQPKVVLPPPNLPGQMPGSAATRPIAPPPPAPRIEAPTPPPQPKPIEKPVQQIEAPKADPNARLIHTMARDMQALKSGTDPFRVAHPAPPAWAEAQTKQVAIVPEAHAPMTPPTPSPASPITPPRETPTPHIQEPLRTHLKQYGVDPYRETVE